MGRLVHSILQIFLKPLQGRLNGPFAMTKMSKPVVTSLDDLHFFRLIEMYIYHSGLLHGNEFVSIPMNHQAVDHLPQGGGEVVDFMSWKNLSPRETISPSSLFSSRPTKVKGVAHVTTARISSSPAALIREM